MEKHMMCVFILDILRIHSQKYQDKQHQNFLMVLIIIMVLVQILFFKCFVPVGGNIVLNFRNWKEDARWSKSLDQDFGGYIIHGSSLSTSLSWSYE